MIVNNIPSSTVVQMAVFNSVIDRFGSSAAGQNSEKALNPVPIFARFVEARRRRILPLELLTLTYALFRRFGGVFDTPIPPNSVRVSAIAGAMSQELGVIGTGSGFPAPHRIETSSKPASQP